MPTLSDDVAVVTGASAGIGRETALALGDAGASVVVADVAVDGGEQTVEMIVDAGGEAKFVETDVSSLEATEAMVETAVETFGGLDIAVNNAGIEGEAVPLAEYSPSTWSKVLDVNLTGVFHAMQAELRVMVEQGAGAIVNTASILGKVGFPETAAYTASKHGVVGLTKVAGIEYAEDGIRVNAVCPGFIDTPMIERYGVTTDADLQAEIEALHAMNRLGEPTEIASLVVWLASDEASFVTGTAVDVDGGYLAR